MTGPTIPEAVTVRPCHNVYQHPDHRWNGTQGTWWCPGHGGSPEAPIVSPSEIARAVMASANLEPGRWAVRVEVGGIPDLGEVAVRAVASVRVHATIGAGERDADPTSGVQAIAHKLGRELRAVIDAHDADTETMRRLHEEATKRNAALSTALEALLTAYETVGAGGGFDVRQRARNAAREVLAS